jgi:hypothetical protein
MVMVGMMKNVRKYLKYRILHVSKCYKGKHKVILKPTRKPVRKQGKYVGGRKNTTKKKCWTNYKRSIKEML